MVEVGVHERCQAASHSTAQPGNQLAADAGSVQAAKSLLGGEAGLDCKMA